MERKKYAKLGSLMQVTQKDASCSVAELLVSRIYHGDNLAEQELVEIYYRGLLFILNRQCRDITLSEDLCQETFLLVITKARKGLITKPAALSSFIRQTGINLLIAHIRKETRRDTHCAEDIDIHAPSDNLDISRALHNENVLDFVQQVINELPTARDREFIRNYFVYDKNKQQICLEFDLSSAHFDRVLFRARQRLKQLIRHKLDTTETQLTKIASLLGLLLMFNIFSHCIELIGEENSILSKITCQAEINSLYYMRENHDRRHISVNTVIPRQVYMPKFTKALKHFSLSRGVHESLN